MKKSIGSNGVLVESFKDYLIWLKNGAILSGMSVYISANFIVSWLSWLFTLQASRILNPEQYGTLSVFTMLVNILTVLPDGISTTISRFAAYWDEKKSQNLSAGLIDLLANTSLILSLILFSSAFIFERQINNFFNLDSAILLRSFLPIIFFIYLKSVFFGYLKAQLALTRISLILILAALVKLALIVLAVSQNYFPWLIVAVVALISAEATSFFLSLIFAQQDFKRKVVFFRKNHLLDLKRVKAVYRFLFNSVFAKVGFVVINSIDFLLVKHFFPQREAGEYALLVTMGNILYFGAKLLFAALIPLVSKELAKGRSGYRPLFILTGMVSFAGLTGLLLYWWKPQEMIRFFIKKESVFVSSYLLPYSTAMFFLAIGSCINTFNIAKNNFLPSRFYLAGTLAIAITILFFHDSLGLIALLSSALLSTTAISLIIYELLNIKTYIGKFKQNHENS